LALPRFFGGHPNSAGDRLGIAFAQVAPGDLDIAIIGQLPPSQLPFDRKLEPGPLEVEGFEATWD